MSTLNLNKNSFTVDDRIWESINDCILPDKKEEDWRYMKWGKLKKLEFHGNFPNQTENLSKLNLPKLTGPIIVIENGTLNEKLSSIPNHKDLIITFDNDDISFQKSSYFDSLNNLLVSEYLNIKVRENHASKECINIVNILSSSNGFVNSRIAFKIAKNANISVNQFFIKSNNTANGLLNHQNLIQLEEHSGITINKYQDTDNNFQFCKDVVNQKNESKYISNNFSSSGKVIRNDIQVKVEGEHCHTELNGIFSPSNNEFIDNHTLIDHIYPNCKSYENYKGLIKSNGVGVFNGKVIVEQDAQQIEAYQQNNNILLDEDAIIYSKPELEIYADDVKCSHGSTTGQFDDEALFYLRSRGLSRASALQHLTLGFVNEIIDTIKDENHKDFILNKILAN